MTFLEAVVLGLFQGIAEFLPISSSGHLVLLQKWFGIKEGNLFFTEMLHFGTLISIVIVYFKDIVKITVEFLSFLRELIKSRKFNLDNQYKVLAIMIIMGSIPTALMGIFIGDIFEGFYDSTLVVSIALIITGILLWLPEKIVSGQKNVKDMKFLDAIIIGTFQGLAITPGISRSGSTIVGGLFRGLNKKLATKFSFLLALPATFGAALLGIKDVVDTQSQVAFSSELIVGIIISAITGVISIKILIKILEKGKLHYFSYYLWTIGLFLLITQLI